MARHSATGRRHGKRSVTNVGLWPDSEVAGCSADFRFLGYSGLVVLTASLSESDPNPPSAVQTFCVAQFHRRSPSAGLRRLPRWSSQSETAGLLASLSVHREVVTTGCITFFTRYSPICWPIRGSRSGNGSRTRCEHLRSLLWRLHSTAIWVDFPKALEGPLRQPI
jgi:hypothetical protein